MWQNPYPWLRVRVFRRIENSVPVPVPVTKTRAKPAGTAVPVQFTICLYDGYNTRVHDFISLIVPIM